MVLGYEYCDMYPAWNNHIMWGPYATPTSHTNWPHTSKQVRPPYQDPTLGRAASQAISLSGSLTYFN